MWLRQQPSLSLYNHCLTGNAIPFVGNVQSGVLEVTVHVGDEDFFVEKWAMTLKRLNL